jgi:DNA-binding transcriptional MerR regulator
MRQRAPTFAARDVCRAIDVPHGTLNSWAHHGLFKGLDAAKTTAGRARRFTLSDLYRLAILKQLIDFGISAENARQWSTLCVQYMDQAPVSEMHVLIYRDGPMVHLGELMNEPIPPGTLLQLTIYPFEIVKTLKERLRVS